MIAHLTPKTFIHTDPAGKHVEKVMNKALASHLNEIEKSKDDIIAYTQGLADSKDRQKTYQTKLHAVRTQLKAQEKVLPPVLPASTKLNLGRLKAHKAVHHVHVDSGQLVIYFNPLFADIRVKEGDRETVRRFLGCYRVHVGPDDKHFRVKNLSFPDIRSHWGCSSSEVPCFGNWTQVSTLISGEQNMYGLADILVSYLTSTEDGGAYQSSHSWVNNRDDCFIDTSNPRGFKGLKLDTLAIFIGGPNDDNSHGGRDLRGTYCWIQTIHTGGRQSVGVKFTYDRNSWNCTLGALTPVAPTDPILASLRVNLENQLSWFNTFHSDVENVPDPGKALLDYLDGLTQDDANTNYSLLAQKITYK